MLIAQGSSNHEGVAGINRIGWRLGEIEIDTVQGHVRQGCEVLMLDRSGYALLVHLVEHAGDMVGKADLLHVGWPGRVVSENSLTKAISKLRKALGDEGAERIQVVHGYGYRLIGDVEPLMATPMPVSPLPAPPMPATSSHSSRVPRQRRRFIQWLGAPILLALALALAWWTPWREATDETPIPPEVASSIAAGIDVVAVLPFRDLSQDGALGVLAEGLANHLRGELQRMPAARLVNRVESTAFRDDPRPLAAIARDLGANLIVSGLVSRADEHVRVHLDLLDTSGRIPSMSRTIERLPTEQASLLKDLTAALMAGISQRPGGFDPARAGTRNPEAHQVFMRAATLFDGNNDPNSQRRTLAILEQALQLDPNYADAWYMYAGILGGGGYWADSVEELVAGRRRALVAMDRSIELAPSNPEGYQIRSEMKLLYFYDWEGAWADIELAERFAQPGESAAVLVWKARYLASAGLIDEAITTDARSIAIDPQAGARRNIGWHYLAKRDTRNARAHLLLALQDLPVNPHINFYLALCDIFEGHPEAALRQLEHSSTLFRLVGTAIAQHELGNRVESDIALKKLTDQFSIPDGYWIGAVHAWRGEIDEAFHWLERGLHNGDNNLMYIPFDPLIENLRGDPRYRKLLSELGVPKTLDAAARPRASPAR